MKAVRLKYALVIILAAASAGPVQAQTVLQPISFFGPGSPGAVIVDDSDPGFIPGGVLANAPLADAVCGCQVSEMTCSWLPDHVPLYLAALDKSKVCLGTAYGPGLHYTAEYRPSSPYYVCGSPGGAWQDGYHHVCQWIPDLSKLGAGCYEVWVYIPWGSTSDAPYTVSDAYGAQTILPFAQHGAGDKCSTPLNSWVRLDPVSGPAETCSSNPKLWRFNGVASGQYLQLDNQTNDPPDPNHPNGLNYVVYDAAAFKLICGASIQVSTFCDANNNGSYDPGVDKIVTGHAVNLYSSADGSGQPISSGTTDWTYNDDSVLRFGTTYSAREQGGTFQPNAKCVLDTCDGHIYIPVKGAITVYKFMDANSNGQRDSGEDGLQGWTIKLWRQNTDGTLTYLDSKTTNSSGECQFVDLDNATYFVSEEDTWQIIPITTTSPTSCELRTTGPDSRVWKFTGAIRDNSDPPISPSDLCANTQDPVIRIPIAISDCTNRTVLIGNAPVDGSITVCQYEDCNMDANPQSSETKLPGWPVELTGTLQDGTPITPQYGVTDAGGCYKFTNLAPGQYTVSEAGSQIQWQKILTTCPSASYCDFRTTWEGGRWQTTTLRPPDDGSGGDVPTSSPITISSNDATISLGVVQLETITSLVFDDLNMNGTYDSSSEPVVANWPIGISGNRADGRPVCASLSTGADGFANFTDIAPSDASGYTVSESLPWSTLTLLSGKSVLETSCPGATFSMPGAQGVCNPWKWRACTETQQTIILQCDSNMICRFGNVGLTELDGVKKVIDADGNSQDPSGWHIYLAGKDVLGDDVTPTDSNNQPLPKAQTPPNQPGGWYEVITDAKGNFSFYGLPPGHYILLEQPSTYHCTMQPPLENGFDVKECPQTVTVTNWKTGKLYQVEAGSSSQTFQSGYQNSTQGVITALPSVLSINPGTNWQNYIAAAQQGMSYELKDVSLAKTFKGFIQCANVFTPVNEVQHGSSGIRLWWPLFYGPPTTTWTLTLDYGTQNPVQLPGESAPGWVHMDVWTWSVDTDIPHMLLYLDALHELPFGNDEVPLISDENLLVTLKQDLNSVQNALNAGDTINAGTLLSDFELTVMDACIGASPAYPWPSGQGTGIANTKENPACCKLLVDSEYIGDKTGAFVQGASKK